MHTIDRGLKENFFRWEGRLNRKRYLKRMLALWIPGSIICLAVLIAVTVIVLDGNTDVRYLNAEQQAFYENMMQGTIFLVLSPFFVSSYMLAIRRLHDVNLPGYFSLLNFIPYVNLGLAVYLLFAEGTTVTNAYGPDPLAPAEKDDMAVQMTKLGAPAEGSVQPAIPRMSTAHASPAGIALQPIFSAKGRLSRRGYALSIGVLFGGAAVASFVGFTLLLMFSYLFANAFFRDTTSFFWAFWGLGVLILPLLVYIALPILAIPATMRRLHDLGHGGFFAFPLTIMSFLIFAIFLSCLLVFLDAVAMETGLPVFFASTFGPSGNTEAQDLAVFILGLFGMLILLGIIFIAYSAWLFFKKGEPLPNAYGDIPAGQSFPSVRAVFFSTQGTIDRRSFILSALLVLAAAGIAVPTVIQFTIYPIIALLLAADFLPAGADFFVLLLGSLLYPLAALPLVIRRLHTLGHGAQEAGFTFAILIPTVLSCIPLARILGILERADENTPDLSPLAPLLETISSYDAAFIGLVCATGIASLISIVRLLAKDADAKGTV